MSDNNKINLFNFLPFYPSFDSLPDNLTQTIFGNDPRNAAMDLYKKKEFYDLRLEETEVPESSVYLKHQLIMQRFLSEHTQYDGIILNHQLGTGKTRVSIGVIEALKNKKLYRGALIIMPGDNLINNYQKELVSVMEQEEEEKEEEEENPNF